MNIIWELNWSFNKIDVRIAKPRSSQSPNYNAFELMKTQSVLHISDVKNLYNSKDDRNQKNRIEDEFSSLPEISFAKSKELGLMNYYTIGKYIKSKIEKNNNTCLSNSLNEHVNQEIHEISSKINFQQNKNTYSRLNKYAEFKSFNNNLEKQRHLK